ncbi:Ig-like domain-containing protein [Novosphingobium resinovorum]|uniref:Ig-like domain-containing protein n=1 Tax=Novosphingobium resinovorum TaxID=158500 RepID=UPI002ED2E574|nr:Ig-like domain-containing protein [Novosphingobium resinovorum]
MPVEVKISPETGGIPAAPVQTVEGAVSIAPGSSVALDVAPAGVAGYSRQGADLLVHLKSGELVRITDFYLDPSRGSHLLLAQEDQLVAADLAQVTGGELASAAYVPVDAMAGFDAPNVAAATVAAAGGGGLSTGLVLPLAILGGGGLVAAAAAGGGSGGEDEPGTPPDTTAPAAATDLSVSAAGDRLTGRAEAGASVRVDADGDGTSDYSATVAADGTFSVALSPPLVNGETLEVTVRDAAGNVGPAASVTAPDIVAPLPPFHVLFASHGGSITGTGEPGATVAVDIDGDGEADHTTQIAPDGTFTITFAAPLDNGQSIDVTVIDGAGNASVPLTVVAPDLTPPPAFAPSIAPTNGSIVTGTAQAGVAVMLSDSAGVPLGQAIVAADGTWSFSPSSPLPDGTVITAAGVNAEGEPGPAATVIVDGIAPAAPVLSPSNGTIVSGTAEAGATILLYDADGGLVGQVVADAGGAWSIVPRTALADGSAVTVIARDAAGNSSPQAGTVIDAAAPSAPILAPANATTISGTAEAGSTVLLSDGAGRAIGQVTADGAGNWSFTTTTPLADGSTVQATARDAAGNLSAAASITVDAIAPAAPTVAASNGAVLSGSAEPLSTVILRDGSGNPLGQVTASASGNWMFTPASPLPDGTVVSVIARDAAGNAGPPVVTTIDAVAPAAPTIQPSSGVVLSGSAEAGALVVLTDGNGSLIGQSLTSANGNWSFTPPSPLPDGTIVAATAQDAAGNIGPQAGTVIDAIIPAVPVVDATNGALVSGNAEPGVIVLLTDGAGNPLGQAVADASGAWSYAPPTPLPNGVIVSAVAQDAAGNTSAAASVTVDALPPATPTIEPSDGTVLSGTAEADALVILVDGDGNDIGQTYADGSGQWSFTPASPLPDSTIARASAQDASGNASGAAATTIDALAPAAPVVAPSNGETVQGTAEAGALVILTDGGGNPIGQVLADGAGNWSFTPGTALPHGTLVNAAAQDAAGNVGPQASTTVDAVAPDAPTIDPTDGTLLSGTAEANSLLILTDGNGSAIGQVTTDGFGAWNFTPAVPLDDGTVVNAAAQDSAGNLSAQASTTVDSTPPAAPTIDPTNGSQVTGTAEPNSTVVLMDGTGSRFAAFSSAAVPPLGILIGEATTDADGNWTFTPLLPLPDGTVVIAVSVDAAGNVSGPVSTVVDGTAPAVPTIDPSAGLLLEGSAEPGVSLRLTDGSGNLIGETTSDGAGHWSFAPPTGLPDGTGVDVVAIDEAGNESPPASIVIDALSPMTPFVEASNGIAISGTAEPDTTVFLTDSAGIPIGQAIVDGAGNWSFTPAAPLPDAALVHVVAVDAAGNTSPVATTTIDSVAPASPVISLLSAGELLVGTAEPNSQVRIVIAGDTAHPFIVTADGSGGFTLPLLTPLIANETISAVAIDAAGNESLPATIVAPDIAPPQITVPEASDGYVNGAEAADGVQVEVTLRPSMQAGQAITASLSGQNGYQAQATHILSAGDILAGAVLISIVPTGSQGALPNGTASVSASIGGGDASSPIGFVIDTTPPATPLLSLLASVLTISSEPGSELTVTADVAGLTAGAVVTADNAGLASLNLLTGLDIGLDWSQLLDAQVSVVSRDVAGNASNVASLAVAPNIDTPVTIGDLGLAVSLNPFSPQFGVSGTTEPNSTVVIRVVTPALNVELLPITADSSGHFVLNLLSPTILNQLGLEVTDILNLGSQISLGMVATDAQGHESAFYGLSLSPAGLSLNIGQIDVNGTLADDVMSGANGAEHINGNSGNDLILGVGAGDHVLAGPGNDTVEITATNFSTIDGGLGFDTLLLSNGIDLDYGPGVGTLANIERIDLGSGDSGSVLTLTASEVAAITDAGDTLQVTGEGNDVLRIVGAVGTGTTETHGGLVYDVYTFGATHVLVEENTVQVLV